MNFKTRLLLGVLCGLLMISCEQAQKPAPQKRAQTRDAAKPLLIFDVHAGNSLRQDVLAEAEIDLHEIRTLYSIPHPLNPHDLKIIEVDDKGIPGPDCVCQVEPAPDSRVFLVWRVQGKMLPNSLRRFGLFVSQQPVTAAALRPPALSVRDTPDAIVAENSFYRIVHPKKANGGLPSEILFKTSGFLDNEIRLNDRLHSKAIGSYRLSNDKSPSVKIVASGPIRTTIEVSARYINERGMWPESQPRAMYRFTYCENSPIIGIAAEVTQAAPFQWNELHFLELYHKKPIFPHWALGDAPESDSFTDTKKSIHGKNWGVVFGPQDALGLFCPGLLLIYDGASEYGTYLHGPWLNNWAETKWRARAELYVGPSSGSFKSVESLAQEQLGTLRVTVRAPILEARFDELRQRIKPVGVGDAWDAMKRWQFAGLQRQAESGIGLLGVANTLDQMATKLPKRKPPAAFDVEQEKDTVHVTNGMIGVRVTTTADGLWVSGLYNGITGTELVKPDAKLQLWEIDFRDANGKSVTLTPASPGIKNKVRCDVSSNNDSALITATARGATLGEEKGVVDVEATARLMKGSPFSTWRIKVTNRSRSWSIWEVRFPQIQPGGAEGFAAYPSGWGVLMPVGAQPFNYGSIYPSGSCAMQFGCFTAGETGLYLAAHDGRATTKKLVFTSDGSKPEMQMRLGQYPEGMSIPGNDYEQSYDVVIGVFKGDWFTAAKIYRKWALKQKWCAKGRLADRTDVSPRIKNIALWALSGGAASQTISGLLRFKERFGVPLATHWYNWHMIPFDNSYPEYFPPKPGFASGVEMAREAGILVMPYINGRLWDVEIVSFPKEAMRFATRDEKGRAYIEVYGSKRKLAPMCPWTKLWQEKVDQIVWRLIDEYGVSGVYTDQVAAAAPRFCMDDSHGHPLGGGGWWVEGYDKMLAPLRARIKAKYPDSFLTTESNAEPYIPHYDAYLMCNSTQGNLIPLFSAVYSDMILTFGRYTFENDAKDENAFFMKEGELFIFGAQLGWISYFPADQKYKEHGDYLKALAECRARAQKFMALGEMLRPLKHKGEMPKVAGQWSVWRTKHKVELPTVMNSVWRAPDGTIGIAFTNIAAQPVTVTFQFDGTEYGLKGKGVEVSELTERGLRSLASYPTSTFLHTEQMPRRSVRFLVVMEK